jgi:ankyrin repeat protein
MFLIINMLIFHIIEKGADIDVTDNQENNLLHAAASVSHPDLVSLILIINLKSYSNNIIDSYCTSVVEERR